MECVHFPVITVECFSINWLSMDVDSMPLWNMSRCVCTKLNLRAIFVYEWYTFFLFGL
jgi:hypothetical protein